MAKKIKLLGAVFIVASAWTGVWHKGESRMRERFQAKIVEAAERGITMSYKSLDIGGFPLSYNAVITDLRIESPLDVSRGKGLVSFHTEEIRTSASLINYGTVDVVFSEVQKVRVKPLGRGAIRNFLIRSDGLTGRFVRRTDENEWKLAGEAVKIEQRTGLAHPLTTTIDKFVYEQTAPRKASGRTATVLDVSKAAFDDNIWKVLDASGHFPRQPVTLKLDVIADITTRGNGALQVDALRLNSLGMDMLGVSLSGTGAAVMKNRVAEGTVNLSVFGLPDFMDNAARAGFIKGNQAGLIRTMLPRFAKKGERRGEQLFKVSFKDGFTFINGAPTFMPAPRIQ